MRIKRTLQMLLNAGLNPTLERTEIAIHNHWPLSEGKDELSGPKVKAMMIVALSQEAIRIRNPRRLPESFSSFHTVAYIMMNEIRRLQGRFRRPVRLQS
ncbi:MAG: hypothetical protein ABIG68_01650, partial [Acidobacteriota bacterium]